MPAHQLAPSPVSSAICELPLEEALQSLTLSPNEARYPSPLPPQTSKNAAVLKATAPTHLDSKACAVGVVYDASMESHCHPEGHVERPARISELFGALQQSGLLQMCWALEPRPVDTTFATATSATPSDVVSMGDLYFVGSTAAAARMATGCCVEAVQQLLSGRVQRALAVVRPPGHHAECQRAMGFCFFNNVAVAALAALKSPGISRVVILDWDIHHGNGIQDIFLNHPQVLYISIHRGDNFYPFTGAHDDVGGPGAEGMTVNIPWMKKAMGDADYMAAFDLVVEPIMRSFSPDLVLVAAGFDAVEGDPLGGCNVSPAGYAHMTERLLQFAGGKVMLALEGGYNVRLVAECGCACMRVLLGEAAPEFSGRRAHVLQPSTKQALERVVQAQGKHWPQLEADAFEERWCDLVAREGAAREKLGRKTKGHKHDDEDFVVM